MRVEKKRPHRALSIVIGVATYASAIALYVKGRDRFLWDCGGSRWCFSPEWAWLWYVGVIAAWLLLLHLAIRVEDALEDKWSPQPARHVTGVENLGHEHSLWALFTTIWVLWGATVFAAEFLYPTARIIASVGSATPLALYRVADLWLAILLAFFVVEGTGAFHSREGDTLSEQVWAFIHGEITRAGIALGLVSLLIVRVVQLGLDTPSTPLGLDLGRLMLGLGVGGWLLFHFVLREMKRHREGAPGQGS